MKSNGDKMSIKIDVFIPNFSRENYDKTYESISDLKIVICTELN